jgi:hypothetical protein
MVLAPAMGEISEDDFGIHDVGPLKLPDNLG